MATEYERVTCNYCGGRGSVSGHMLGRLDVNRAMCPMCHGTGHILLPTEETPSAPAQNTSDRDGV